MKKGKTPLEMIIRAHYEMNQGSSPMKMRDGQLELIELNWDESKDILGKMAFEVKDGARKFIDVNYVFKALKDRGVVDVEKYIREEIFPVLIEKENYGDVCFVTNSTGILPDKEQVANVWTGFSNQDSPSEWDLKSLIAYFGKPESLQGLVDKIANNWLAEMAGERENTGSLRQPDQILQFLEFSGVKPVWDRNLAMKAYDYWFTERQHFHEPLFEFLRCEIGVEPDENKVHAQYAVILSGANDRHKEISSITLESLDKAIRATNVKPAEDAVRLFYARSLSSRNLYMLKKIESLTGVKMDEEIVKKKYQELLFAGDIDELEELRGKLDVLPNFGSDIVQQAYESVFSNGNIRGAMKLYELTKMRPIVPEISKEVKENACKIFVKAAVRRDAALIDWEDHRTDQERLREERDVAKALFADEIKVEIQAYMREFVENGKRRQVERFSFWWGIDPLPEEQYVLACLDGNWKKAREVYAKHKKEIVKRYPEYAQVLNIAP
ncbi:hypothetical protein J4219_05830 [Candidatus Woesearchaeota archaeon]|nr:hypothetical protein [Candidatus Woesearchaeota archaeon]